jgi:hypothetical protein
LQRDLVEGTLGGAGRGRAYRAQVHRIVPTALNGQPAALAYARMDDGRWVAVCMTVMTLAEDGRVSAMDVFVLLRHLVTWGPPPALE